jgi:excinuclease UvrABC ATPase subunit
MLIVEGTPERVAATRDSHTGAFLRHMLEPEEALAG